MTKPKKATKSRRGQSASKAMLAAVLEEIPTNWCDPLLSGPKAVIGSPPYTGKDLENLVLGIRARIEAKFKAANDGANPRRNET
jgi:hypothetical protein